MNPEFQIVDPSNSSCAEQIDAVFQRYGLDVQSFDIRFYDGNGRHYKYASSASSNESTEKIDEQPNFSPTSTSSFVAASFSASTNTIAPQFSHEQVLTDIRQALASEGTTLDSASVTVMNSEGEACDIRYPPSGNYGPR